MSVLAVARIAAFLVVVAGLMIGASSSHAQIQVPTLPVPVPQLPPLPVPLPPPNLPPVTPPSPPPSNPAPPAPPSAPPSVGAAVGAVGGLVQGATGALTGGSSSGSSGSAGGSSASPSSAGGSAGAGAGSAAAPRPGAAGPVRAAQPGIRNEGRRDKRRAAVIAFRLERAAVVRFRVRQESPDCAVVGSFTVRGKPGRNRVRFHGRIRGVALPPGTYSLTATAFRNGRATRLGRTFVVVVGEGGDPRRARPAQSTCRGEGDGTGGADILAGAGGISQMTGGSGLASQDGNGSNGTGGSSGAQGATASGGLDKGGAQVSESSRGGLIGVPTPLDEAPTWLKASLLAALLLAIVLLLLAALPTKAVRPAGAAPTVVRRRPQFALLGATILGAVTILALAL